MYKTKLSLKARAKTIEVLNASEHPLDSLQVKRLVEAQGNPSQDWHEYMHYLEDLTARGIAKYTGMPNDGHQKYRIAEF